MALPNIPLFKVHMAEGVHSALKPVLGSGQLACGPQVAQFEARLAAQLGTTRAVALSDASAALTLALYLAGVRPGDEVITSPLACAATVMPIANLFARPVWCDIDSRTGMIDPAGVTALITSKTRALLVYHWSGNVADIEALRSITEQHNIALIQDASEAFGAEYGGRKLTHHADFTVYSFYATKHINCGEGGALIAADPVALESASRLRRFGIDYALFRLPNANLNPHLDIPVAGFNFAMNEIAATLGLEALKQADDIVARHRDNGRFYETALAACPGVTLLEQLNGTVSGYWTFSLCVERRDDMILKLLANGIGAQRLHLRNDGYTCFGGASQSLTGVAKFDAENLCIPCGWWVGPAERARIVDCIQSGW